MKRRDVIILIAVGAIVGAVAGGFGFGDGGVNVTAGAIGLTTGVVVMAVLSLVFSATPSWLLQTLGGAFGGWLFAGIIWELKFERKLEAQTVGLVLGFVFTLLLLNRERIAGFVKESRRRDKGTANEPAPDSVGPSIDGKPRLGR